MKKINLIMLSLILMALLAMPALAAKPLTPETIDGGEIVSTDWVKANYGKVPIFDVRKKAEYVEGHIKGAISTPYKEKSAKTVDFDASMDKLDLSKFPADKNAAIVVHCNGPRCWKSYKSAITLIKAGYTNVKWYRDGYPDWKAKGFPIQ